MNRNTQINNKITLTTTTNYSFILVVYINKQQFSDLPYLLFIDEQIDIFFDTVISLGNMQIF